MRLTPCRYRLGKCQSEIFAILVVTSVRNQHAETVNGYLNRFEDKLAWIAYLNAGVRVLDISDPQNLREVGYYIPKTNASPRPSQPRPVPIQLTDVDIDHRGLVYASDRSGESCMGQGEGCVGTGLFVLEYTGN
ncbi:MAG: hypothetical protein CM1200mP36_04760 [Gammaproteobacteria bacterium]|nr:MAG: hypothetical protein CM1200mP36_04760 [Gammaproteobacteria bacterium]